jgi:NADH-quinone oxidoreductase subunit J
MTATAVIFHLLAALLLGAALVGVVLARKGSSIVGAFLLCMVSLAGIFALLDAHLVAVAQLLVSIALSLLLYFTNGVLSEFGDDECDLQKPGRWRWLVALVGVGLASWFGLVLHRISGEIPAGHAAAAVGSALSSPRAVAASMFGDYAIAVVGIGFLFLSALIGAGYLGRRGLD